MPYVTHPIPPLYDGDSRVLILGSFPSVKSREGMFFYHHPQNRFWKVLAALLGEPLPGTVAEKAALLHRHHIALWDVIAACAITGSQDSSITGAVPNDLTPIFEAASIQAVFLNGTAAWDQYRRAGRVWGGPAGEVPSPSPAHAARAPPQPPGGWAGILPYL